MTITVITNTSSGAPTLSGTVGSLIGLLDFCLVTTLGWTKPYTGTNLAAYKQPAGTNGFYLYVDDTQAQYARLRGYEVMTSISAGSGPFPTEAIQTGGFYLRKSEAASSTARPWYFVSDGKIFHLVISVNASSLVWASPNFAYSFGDCLSLKSGDMFATVLIADTNSAPTNSSSYAGWTALNTTLTGVANGHALARPHTQIGSAVAPAKVVDTIAGNSGTFGHGSLAYPNPISGGIDLSRAFLAETAGRRATVPGVWFWNHSAAALGSGDTFYGAAGSLLAGRSFVFFPQGGFSTVGSVVLETSDTWGS